MIIIIIIMIIIMIIMIIIIIMGRVKQKIAFEHAQNAAQIQVILRMRKLSLLSIHTFFLCSMRLLADSEGSHQTARMRRLI